MKFISNFAFYLFFIISITIILFASTYYIYTRLYHHFWSIQPVFLSHYLSYYFFNQQIINKELPKINHYCNLTKIKTYNIDDLLVKENKTKNKIIKETSNFDINDIVIFIKNNYNPPAYNPKQNNILPYFKGTSKSSLISLFTEKTLIYTPEIKYKEKEEIIGCITSKPVNIEFIRNNNKFICYYCDWLTVSKLWRKKGIAQQLIQTHEYNQRHCINDISVSLFKREGYIMGIVPVIIYKTYLYARINIDLFADVINYDIIKIGKDNYSAFIDYHKDNIKQFDISIIADYSNILELVLTKNLYIYALVSRVEHNAIKAVYMFRNSMTYQHYENRPRNIIVLIASIKNTLITDDMFISFFQKIIDKNEMSIGLIAIENLSHNCIISAFCNNPNNIGNNYFLAKSTASYYFYNYIANTIKNNKAIVII